MIDTIDLSTIQKLNLTKLTSEHTNVLAVLIDQARLKDTQEKLAKLAQANEMVHRMLGQAV